MKLRKLTAVLLAGMMCVGMLAGCGSSEKISQKDNKEMLETAAGADTTYDGKITMLFASKDEYLSYLDQAAKTYAGMKGVDFKTIDCGEDIDAQVQYVSAAVKEGAGAVVVITADNTRTQDLIDAAGDVPMVFVNRCPSEKELLDEKHVYIGSNEDECGAYQGEALVEALKASGKTSVKYVMLKGIDGHDSTTKRTAGVLKALSDAGITATPAAELSCGFDRTAAMNEMTSTIASGLDMSTVDCIISNNDAMALGAMEACNQAGVDLSKIAVVGVDGLNDAIRAVANGTMAGTVYQNAAAQAAAGVQAAINLASGAKAADGLDYEVSPDNASIIWIPFEKVTAANAAQY